MPKLEKAAYEEHRKKMAARMRDMRAAGSEIGEIPKIAKRKRRKSCGESFQLFCETYRPAAFHLGWSRDHLRVIQQIETTARDGGLFALAMPRGNGKTTLAITAAMWALLYGYRRWVCLIGATETKAEKLLGSIKSELRFNSLLLEDFPEVCFPIRALEGRASRANGQTHNSEPTGIQWLNNFLILPTIDGSKASGSVVSVCGITGDVRGQQFTTPNGEVLRPDYVIPDDPQTRESASSSLQTDSRIAIINGDVLGLSGPGVKIAGVMPCTVIRKGDLADTALDREESPEWHGERTQLLYGMPSNMDLWNQYSDIRKASFRNGGKGEEATQFYGENQAAMDMGCEASWSERFNPDEISAIQNAMNLYFRSEEAFWAEYQNHPLELKLDESILSEDEMAKRVGITAKGQLQEHTDKVVGFIDVQKELLFYAVVSWKLDFSGTVVEYGAWPQQRGNHFKLSTARKNLSKMYPGDSLEVKLTKALKDLVGYLMDKKFRTATGGEIPFSRIMIDANWGQSRNLVYEFCRTSSFRSVLYPSHGKGVTASSEPLNAAHVKKFGRAVGQHWRIDRARDVPIRHIIYDTNFWKSFFHSRLSTEPGTSGSLVLYQAEPHEHATLAKHLKAEYPVRTKGKGREVDEWKLKPDRPDNHWLDCLVGCCVAGSVEGCKLAGEGGRKVKKSRAAVESIEGITPGVPAPPPPEEQGQQPARPKRTRRVEYL
jgi:hypothetical protein